MGMEIQVLALALSRVGLTLQYRKDRLTKIIRHIAEKIEIRKKEPNKLTKAFFFYLSPSSGPF